MNFDDIRMRRLAFEATTAPPTTREQARNSARNKFDKMILLHD